MQRDPYQVAEYNWHVRQGDDFLRECGRWPADWLVTGQDGCGNYWAIDLSRDPCPVLYYDHEYGDAQIVSPDFVAFRATAYHA